MYETQYSNTPILQIEFYKEVRYESLTHALMEFSR
jgi:hypothetical protein